MTGTRLNTIFPATSALLGGVKPDGTTISNTAGAIAVANPATAVGTSAVGQIQATAINDSAAAGKVGEFFESTIVLGSAVSLSTGTAKNVTSISLTAGDWDVAGTVELYGDATTTPTYAAGGINTTTNTLPVRGGTNYGEILIGGTPFATSLPNIPLVPSRYSLNTTTTIYLVALMGFTVSTAVAFGTIRARRIR